MRKYDRDLVDRYKRELKLKTIAAEELLAAWITNWTGDTELTVYEHMDLKIKLINTLLQNSIDTNTSDIDSAVRGVGSIVEYINSHVSDIAQHLHTLQHHITQKS